MNSEDLPLGVRRAMLRPTTLQQPVARVEQRPIPEPQDGLERVLTPERTIEPQNEGAEAQTKDENYDHHIDSKRPNAALEPSACNAPLEAKEVQGRPDGRFHVRITSIRKRLADEDGLCEKYLVDCCRYAGLIPEDSPGICHIETTQRKAAKGEEERTEITIEYPNL